MLNEINNKSIHSKEWMIKVSELVFISCFIAGISDCVCSAFDMNSLWYGKLLCIFCCISVFLYFNYNNKNKNYIAAVTGIIVLIVIMFLFSYIVMSAKGFINSIAYSTFSQKIFEKEISGNVFLYIITGIIGMFITLLVSKRKIFAIEMVMVISFFTILLTGCMPDVGSIVIVLISITGFVVRTRIIYVRVFISLVCICLYFVLCLTFPEGSYNMDNTINSFWQEVMQSIGNTQSVSENNSSGGVYKAPLGNIDKIEYSHIPMLKVTTSQKGHIYLRGYTGSVLQDNTWNEFCDDIYNQYPEIFDSDTFNTINSYRQQVELFSVLETDNISFNGVNYSKVKYKVEYENASKEMYYLPYNSVYSVREKSSKDGFPKNNKNGFIDSWQYVLKLNDRNEFFDELQKNINIDLYSNIETEEKNTDSEIINTAMYRYVQWEHLYRKYVYNEYTVVDDISNEAVIKAEAPVYDKESQTIDEYVQSVREYLNNRCVYTLEPGRVAEGRNIVDYFLNDNRQGYCTYFASAAVIIFRHSGIPARYVEGYRIDTHDYGNEQTYWLDDSNAHAWAEIYIDGYGWVSVEVTSGIADDDYGIIFAEGSKDADYNTIQENNNISDSDLQNELDNSYEDNNTVNEQPDKKIIPQYQNVLQEYSSFSDYVSDPKTGKINYEIAAVLIKRDVINFLIKLLVCIALIAFIIIAVFIPAILIHFKRKWIFVINSNQTPDMDRKQIIDIYGYIEKLGSFYGVKRYTYTSYKQFGESLLEKKDYFKEADISKIIISVQKAAFGRGNIGKQEMKTAVEGVVLLKKKAWEKSTTINKIKYIFIYHLW